MTSPSPARRTAHVSSAPEESYLLGLQLKQEGLAFDVETVKSKSELGRDGRGAAS